MALIFGTAGLPHILMRFFTVPDAKAARKSVLYATGFIGYFYILTFIIGFGAIVLVANSTDLRAALASVTVKKRIRICGKPAVPNISVMAQRNRFQRIGLGADGQPPIA